MMPLSAEQFLNLAQIVRRNGARASPADSPRYIQNSNSFVLCVRFTMEETGRSFLTDGFDWHSMTPDWVPLMTQVVEGELLRIWSPPLAAASE